MFGKDQLLETTIVIHDNKGNLVSSLEISDIVITLQFLDNQKLLVVYQNGSYMVYDCLTKEISNLLWLGKAGQFTTDELIVAKAIESSIVFVTRNNAVNICSIGDKQACILIHQEEKETSFNTESLSFLSLNLVKHPAHEIQIFIPLTRGGVLKLVYATQSRVERLLTSIAEPVIKTSVSPNGENLAALTRSGKLSVMYIKNPSNVWTKSLELEEKDPVQKLEWVACYAVAIVYSSKFFLACCGMEEAYFTPIRNDDKTLAFKTTHIITRSEIDGLRVIRIFDNSKKQDCSIIRRLPPAYINVLKERECPATSLLQVYNAKGDEKKVIKVDDIRQFKNKLVDGVSDLIDAGCFEENEVCPHY